MEESQQKILNQCLGSPVASGAQMPLREGCPELRVGKLFAPIRNFPFHLGYWPSICGKPENAAFEVFWCFQHCDECRLYIGGWFGIETPDGASYHCSCLLRRGQRRAFERLISGLRDDLKRRVGVLPITELARVARLMKRGAS